MRVKFIWPYDVAFVTGPISGPVQPGDEHDVSDEEGAVMVASGYWIDATPPAEVVEAAADTEVAADTDVEQPKGGKKQAIAKADLKKDKEVQSQDQQ